LEHLSKIMVTYCDTIKYKAEVGTRQVVVKSLEEF